MNKLALGLAPFLFAIPGGLPAQPSPAPDYASEASWLCLPGRADACSRPLAVAELRPAGFGPVRQAVPARNPRIDCFYVYPTISRDAGDNSDMNPGLEEQGVAMVQFARFSSLCRPFAPIYRQATLAALLRAVARGESRIDALERAYGDVVLAWRHFLAQYNRGRPFVLIGHSQGTVHLIRLLAEQIEGRPEARRMLSALLIGFNVEVPEGRLFGGSLPQSPLCTRSGQIGCAITYVSFRAASPPPAISFFGRAARPGMTVSCTNPARLGGGSAALDSLWYSGPSFTNTQSQVTWSSAGPPPAPFLRTRGLVGAECVNAGPLGYLAVSVNADPADARTDRIPGDVMLAGQVQPGWGLHLADVNLAMGDLLRAVERQRDTWFRRRR
ncbi:MAG: DUF3089 domain-containing protein [Sphingosinicella sp.]